MKPGGMRDETAETWLADLVWQLCVLAQGDVDRMERFPEEAVHALRVRMKKLRAVLRLGEDAGVDLSRLKTRCKAIMKGVSRVRDEAVMRRLMAELFGQSPIRRGAKTTRGWGAVRLRREVDLLARLAVGTPLPGLTSKRVGASYRVTFKRVRTALKRCDHTEDAECFHALRKRVKVLHFQSLALCESVEAADRIRSAKSLGKMLGKEHDLAVLKDKLASLGVQSELLDVIEKRRLRMHKRIRKEGMKLVSL